MVRLPNQTGFWSEGRVSEQVCLVKYRRKTNQNKPQPGKVKLPTKTQSLSTSPAPVAPLLKGSEITLPLELMKSLFQCWSGETEGRGSACVASDTSAASSLTHGLHLKQTTHRNSQAWWTLPIWFVRVWLFGLQLEHLLFLIIPPTILGNHQVTMLNILFPQNTE